MMSTDYSPCPVCGLEEAHAVMENAQLSIVSCQRCGAVVTYEPDDEECREFDWQDYEWVSPKDQCPEEASVVLVDFNGGPNGDNGESDYGVAVYLANEGGDHWILVNEDGSDGPEIAPPNAWADLPAVCFELPQYHGGKTAKDYQKPQVYQWGPAWFWSIPYEITKEGNRPAVCGPFESKKEAAADLEVKLKEIKEMES